jgi:hypothetical protein
MVDQQAEKTCGHYRGSNDVQKLGSHKEKARKNDKEQYPCKKIVFVEPDNGYREDEQGRQKQVAFNGQSS